MVMLVGLVVAPSCCPLCAAQSFGQGPDATEMTSNCHSHVVADHGAVYLQAVRSCGVPDLQAANLPALNRLMSLRGVRAKAFHGGNGVRYVNHCLRSAANSTPIGAALESPPRFCSANSPVVLRI